VSIERAPAGQIDPVYVSEYGKALETGVARDANGNALGGIRLPDLALGRGQYIAADPASYLGLGLLGAFHDLQCEPLPDGSPRFRDHASYASQFTQQVQALAAQGFLLPADAERLIAEATASNVGDPAACPLTVLPETGQTHSRGVALRLLIVTSLILVITGLVVRQRARHGKVH
jgi:hypothetical protein